VCRSLQGLAAAAAAVDLPAFATRNPARARRVMLQLIGRNAADKELCMVPVHQQPMPPQSAPAAGGGGGDGAHLLLYVSAVSSSGALRVTCAHVRVCIYGRG
jgi:hypothetical protein